MTHALSARGLFLIAIEPCPLLKSRFGLLIARRQNCSFTMIEQAFDQIAHNSTNRRSACLKIPQVPFHGPHGMATDVFAKPVRAATESRSR